MLTIVTCTACGKAGTFDIALTFSPKDDHCKTCGHDPDRRWRWQFCILSCFTKWLKEKDVDEKGFPCQDCVDFETGLPTGFWFGHKENGKCKTCDGQKAVKGRLIAVDPYANMKPGIVQK